MSFIGLYNYHITWRHRSARINRKSYGKTLKMNVQKKTACGISQWILFKGVLSFYQLIWLHCSKIVTIVYKSGMMSSTVSCLKWSRQVRMDPPTKPPASIFELFKYSSVSDLILFSAGCVCAIVSGLAIPVLTIAFGSVLDSFVEFSTSNDNTTSIINQSCSTSQSTHEFDSKTYISAGITLSAGFFNFFLSYFYIFCLVKSSSGQSARIKKVIFESLLRQEVSYFDDLSSGSLASNISTDMSKIEAGTGEKIGFLLRSTSLSAASLLVALIYGWKMTLVCLCFTPFVIATSTVFLKIQATYTELESVAYNDSWSIVTEVLTLIKTVHAFEGERKELKRFENSLIPVTNLGQKRALWSAASIACYWTFTYITFAIGIWFGISEIAYGEDGAMTGGSMFIVFWNIGAIGYFSGQILPHLQVTIHLLSAVWTVARLKIYF